MVVFSCRRQEVTFGVLSGQTLGCGVVFDQVGVFKGREGEVAIESKPVFKAHQVANSRQDAAFAEHFGARAAARRSEEHTSELQSRPHLVCRLLLEKKKKKNQL